VGVDTQPYRIFNIWLQAKRYDPECIYIKKWVPELKSVSVKDILSWEKATVHGPLVKRGIYLEPIVEHGESSKLAKNMLMGI
jgi:deoxyribodipyrimidine photo-lyase